MSSFQGRMPEIWSFFSSFVIQTRAVVTPSALVKQDTSNISKADVWSKDRTVPLTHNEVLSRTGASTPHTILLRALVVLGQIKTVKFGQGDAQLKAKALFAFTEV